MKNLLLNSFLFVFLINTDGISMQNLQLGDNRNKLENIDLKKIGYEEFDYLEISKFLTKNGNHLSVTIENEKIIFLENDFIDSINGQKPLVTNFTFGKTTLNEIRMKLNSNGFSYNNRFISETETSLVMLNCYELKSNKNEIIIFITAIPLTTNPTTSKELGDLMKLDAIIISNKDFLDEIWGADKSFDHNYTPIDAELLN